MQTSACGDNYISYTIAKGQTLYGIAQQFNTTVANILAANPALDVQLYYAGDTICIPRTGTGGGNACQGTAYTIRRGDSFYLVAQRFGIPLSTLLEANPGVDPARLQVGQIICVPTATTTPTPCPRTHSSHTVSRGQTFADILILYNISYNALVQANQGINMGSLAAGQELCVAPAGARGVCATGAGPYELVSGDTLGTMASRFGTTVGAILAVNPTMSPTDFISGRIICLPEGARVGG